MLNSLLPLDWTLALEDTLFTKEVEKLFAQVEELYEQEEVLPGKEDIFNAFKLTPFDKVKVVILGQDPYPNPENAMGLAFSVKEGVRPPASLKNIYKQIERDFGYEMNPNNGNLTPWAKQGVLLLNTGLTVKAWEANSHKYLNWLQFTSKVIEAVSQNNSDVVFLLWGREAQAAEKYIQGDNNHVIQTSHPSPLGAGKLAPIPFNHSGIFKLTNQILEENGRSPIDWQIK